MNAKKIIFFPTTGDTNLYVNILVRGLKSRGNQIYSLKDSISSPRRFFQARLVHLNWFENIEVKSVFFKRVFLLLLFILTNKRIVWTIHNKIPHEDHFPRLTQIMMKLLFRFSDRLVIHSRSSLDVVRKYGGEYIRKTVYVPHPDYIGIYGPQTGNTFSPARLKLLFVGAVNPYKNIELLIDTVKQLDNQKTELVIAGKPKDAAYAQQITKRVGNHPSIRLDLRYLDDSDLVRLLGESDILVLPYDQRSSLNSGTVLLAFSYGKTVICPAIGTVTDYETTQPMLVYDYNSPAEHAEQLKSALVKAQMLHQKDPEIFRKWGKEVYGMVSRRNDKEAVVRQLDELYLSIY